MSMSMFQVDKMCNTSAQIKSKIQLHKFDNLNDLSMIDKEKYNL